MGYEDKMMRTEDIEIRCAEKDCQLVFIFSVGEQQFFKEKGLAHTPTRCPNCRKKRKYERDMQKGQMLAN